MSDLPALPALTAHCADCAGLCCVMLAFDKGEDFALDKAAQSPCPNLAPDFTCAIHAGLAEAGFSGCQRYDCLGAGQRVVQEVFNGKDWRRFPELLPAIADAFATMRQLHRDLELLLAARALPLNDSLKATLTALLAEATPPNGFTQTSLTDFAKTEHAKRVAAFLRSLRDHV